VWDFSATSAFECGGSDPGSDTMRKRLRAPGAGHTIDGVSELRATDRRIVVLDVLRGVCFVLMTMDHLPGDPFLRFSNPNYGIAGFFTAALGFVFLSGLVAGIVYEKHRSTYGSRSTSIRILRRMRGLYLTQVLLCLVLLAAVSLHLHGAAQWHLDLFGSDPWKGLVFSLTLLYEPEYLGILPMYCLFLLCTPFVLHQFEKGRVRLVLAVSFALWLAAGLMLHPSTNSHGVDFGAFNPLSYQLLFIIGVAFGAGKISLDRLSTRQRQVLIASSAGVALLFFALRQEYALDGPVNPLLDRLANMFSAVELGPLRLLNFAAFAVVLYWIFRKVNWSEIHAVSVRWLGFVGRHSLPVFAWSILATYAAVAVLPAHPGVAAGVISAILVTASLTIPAQLRAIVVRRRVALPGPSPGRRQGPVAGSVGTHVRAKEQPTTVEPAAVARQR
jgi:hypothetical protein